MLLTGMGKQRMPACWHGPLRCARASAPASVTFLETEQGGLGSGSGGGGRGGGRLRPGWGSWWLFEGHP